MKKLRLFLLMSLLAAMPQAHAQRSWDGTVAESFAGGSGTKDDPYRISNASEFMLLRRTDTNGLYFELTNDIIFSRSGSQGENRTAILQGHLDGKGYIVYGFNAYYSGVFDIIYGTMKNIGFTNFKSYRYGFARNIYHSSTADSAHVTNCFVEGDISFYGTYDMYGDRSAMALHNDCYIENSYYKGTLFCYNVHPSASYQYARTNSGHINNCYSDCKATGSYGISIIDKRDSVHYSNITTNVEELNAWVAAHGEEYSPWGENGRQEIFNKTRNDIYTVTFDPNGGTCNEQSRQVANGASIGELPTPVNTDKKFIGWYYCSELANDSYPISGNLTLKAKWENEIKVQPTLEQPTFIVSDMEHARFQWYKCNHATQHIDLEECSSGSYKWKKLDNGSFVSVNHSGNSSCKATKEITVQYGDKLTVDYSVSSENGYDEFIITWNNTELLRASGDKPNQSFEYTFTDDETGTLTLSYTKDSSENDGDDIATVAKCAIEGSSDPLDGETSATLSLANVQIGDIVYCKVTYSNDDAVFYSETINIPEGFVFNSEYIAMDNHTVKAGQTFTLPVIMKNKSTINSIGGIITLPEGMEIEKNAKGKFNITLNEERASADDAFSVSSNILANGSVKFLVVSTDGSDISGNDGAIIYVPVVVGEELEGDYDITLSAIQMADTDANLIDCPNATATITVEQYTLGDVNNDGQIAPNDITLTIKSYLGDTPANFCFKAADINANSVIDPADITAIVKLYLSEDASYNARRKATVAKASGSITAKDEVHLSDVTVEKGQECNISLSMNLQRYDYTSLGGIITIPEGFSFVKNAKGKLVVTKNADVLEYHTVSTNLLNNRQMKFYIGSNDLDLIEPGLSTLISVRIMASEDIAGGDYTYTITSLQLSDYDANLYDAASAEGCLHVPGGTIELVHGIPYTNSMRKEGVTVSYTRTFAHTEWQAMYVPFDMAYEDWAGNAQVAQLTGATKDALQWTVIGSGKLAANTPCIIKPYATGPVTFTTEDATLEASASMTASQTTGLTTYTLTGIYEEKTDMATSGAYGLSKGVFYRTTDNSKTLKPYQIYLTIEGDKPASVKSVVYGEDGATVIDEILPASTDCNAAYDLLGRKASKQMHGVHIQNGKKTINNK